ncbi:hypothetical protein Tco_0519575 [Tanacetum coccineum]
MDSIIPIGEKNTLAEYMILSGTDNRPPMLDKDLTKKYDELSTTGKIQADCDLKETNIILHGLPLDIYSLVNHHRVAKDLWEKSPQYGSNLPTQHYSATYASTPHAITYPSALYPNAYSSTVHQETCPQPQFVPQIEYTVSTVNQQTYLAKFPQIDSGLAVPMFKQGDDPIDVISVYWRQNSYVAGMSYGKTVSKAKKEKGCYMLMEKVLLVKAQRNGKVLNGEELEFLTNPGIVEGPVT